MKSYLTQNYDRLLLWIGGSLLLISLLVVMYFCITPPPSGASSFQTKGNASLTIPASKGASALDRLEKVATWNTRTDGASPFVSRPYILKEGKLFDPLNGSEPLHPPVPNQWFVEHQLDYADVDILTKDPKGKGFTLLEEFNAGTDPNNPHQFPPLYIKLKYADADLSKNTYRFDFLGVDDSEGVKKYQLRPLNAIPNPTRKDAKADTTSRSVAIGETIPGAPTLKVVDYLEKKKIINDTEYDFSELVLENTLTGKRINLTQKNISKEYHSTTITTIEGVTLHYQLTGAPDQTFTLKRGDEIPLASLDKSFSEIYKLKDFSDEGILLEKDGATLLVKAPAE
jgi:hypothetical protein